MSSTGSAGDPAPTFHSAAEAATAAGASAGNVATLLGGIIDDSTKLIKEHLVMLQAEVKQDLGKAASGAKYLGVGAFLALVGLFFILVGVPLALHHFFPKLPPWACFMLFGTVLLVAGLVGFLVGQSFMKKFNPLPQKTLNAISENVSWLTKPQK